MRSWAEWFWASAENGAGTRFPATVGPIAVFVRTVASSEGGRGPV